MSKFDWEDSEDWRALSVSEKAALLKSAVSMTDVVELCGHDVDKDKVRPPWNPVERTPSTHLYEDHFYDYGSGRHGDIFDWISEESIAESGQPLSLGKAISRLRKLALRCGKEPGDVDRQPVRVVENLLGLFWDDSLQPYDFEGLGTEQYGVMLDRCTGDILVPHWYQAVPPMVYGVKYRRAGGGKDAAPGSQFTLRLYNPTGWQPMSGRGTVCIITEGESDCWAMRNALPDIDVFSLPSGASSWKDTWLEDLAPYDRILLCFDNDRAGKQAYEKVLRKIGYDRAAELRVPQLYNDAREALKAGWEPKI